MLALVAAMTVATTGFADTRPLVTLVDPAGGSACKATSRYEIAERTLLYRNDGKAKMSVLGQLPKANHEKAVLRTVDGCATPVTVGYGVGR